MASGRMAPRKAKSGRNVDLRLPPDSRLVFRRQVRQTHGTHGTQGIIFANDGSQLVTSDTIVSYPFTTIINTEIQRVNSIEGVLVESFAKDLKKH